jgi:hypothetical protein
LKGGFKVKKYLALAVFMVLALVFSLAGVKDASADATFGNAFRTDGDWITLVTVVNKSTSADPCIHWMYRYDNPATSAKECYHSDRSAAVTPNDMLTVDVSNTVQGGNPIPSSVDTTSDSYNIGPGYAGFFTLYSFSASNTGDCVLDYQTGWDSALGENSLNTEVVLANLATGEAYRWKAPNDGLDTEEGNMDDLGYGAYDGGFRVPAVTAPTAIWLPTAAVDTQWYVNVLTMDVAFDDMGDPSDEDTLSTVLAFADGAGNPGWWYNINENVTSSIMEPSVDCFEYLDLTDFIDPASLPLTVAGGWANIQIVSHTPGDINKSILVNKLEATNALGGGTNYGWTSQNRIDY